MPRQFTGLMHADFSTMPPDALDFEWVPQEFNVTASEGRGRYGKAFQPKNVLLASSPASSHLGENGLLLKVLSKPTTWGAIPSAEIDSRRVDLQWGSYRASLKLPAVTGTCSAFFWVGDGILKKRVNEANVSLTSTSMTLKKSMLSFYPENSIIQITHTL